MRAIRLTRYGEPLSPGDVPLPEAGPGEVLVDMAFGGVNPVDRYVAAGAVASDGPLPRTLGSEGSGHVGGVPVAVLGHGLGRSRDGVWAEKAIVPEGAVLELPSGVPLDQAATVGIAGATAWRVVDMAGLTPSDRVVVFGASGGVGSLVCQLAASAGAAVWGQTGDAEKAGFVSRSGAHALLVGGAEEIASEMAEVAPTVVFDPLGDGFTAAAVECLEPFGRLFQYGTSASPSATLDIRALYRKGLSVSGYAGLIESFERIREAAHQALAALAEGKMSVEVSSCPMDDVTGAFRLLEERRVTGKVVLDLQAR